MSANKTSSSPEKKIAGKEALHTRNAHKEGYNFKQLCKTSPGLRKFVFVNDHDKETIDFGDPNAVKTLNQALLKEFYGVGNWEIPEGYLCPPIPGRADYIHYVADLLAGSNNGVVPKGDKISVLDIGAGANCVYPLIGNSAYRWNFIGSDIDPVAIRSAKHIVEVNKGFKDKIHLRLQTDPANIFTGIIQPGERFDLTICNPPFHASAKEARESNATKWKKLGKDGPAETLNFGGQVNELSYKGGEPAFIRRMIDESTLFARQCLWFTTLVSKKETLPPIYKMLDYLKAVDVKTISMKQGQKTSRILAWTFLTPEERTAWQADKAAK